MADVQQFSVKKRKREEYTFTIGGEPRDEFVYTFTPPKKAIIALPLFEDEDTSNADVPLELRASRGSIEWFRRGLLTPRRDELGGLIRDEDGKIVKDEAQWTRILDRLRDEDDDLDWPDLEATVQWLASKVGERPTT